MKFQFTRVKHRRTGFLLWIIATLIVISTITRLLLTIKSFSEVDITVLNVAQIIIAGLFFDVINAVYFSLPIVLYLWLTTDRFYQRKANGYILTVLYFLVVFGLIFNGVAEWLFWDEFSARFNFIAVDYLVYTTEVIGNIHQSYPIAWIIVIVTVVSAGVVYFMRPKLLATRDEVLPFKVRTKYFLAYVLIFILVLVGVSGKYHQLSNNAFVNELSGNGLYELFAAYRNNELNYDQFYKTIGTADAFRELRKNIATEESEFISSDSLSIRRKIVNAGEEKHWNVVLISVESFSAEFMGHFGNSESITPFLDSLSDQSLLFTNLYATGTRTVRGLEALSICVPPTPGQSIVRRPDNEDLFSLGKIFNSKGYRSQYIYGGYSYFDNMGYFFGNNGYQIVDRSALKDEEIAYENIWGVADENLFDLALRQVDEGSKTQPVFAHVMTTSNHRPFTYPEGRIDIPSHTSREGAVKYTDYAIGRFIKEASTHTWFKNTLFIIVADHCASSAGKTELPVDKYHIPMLIYSPGNVVPGKMDRLMSQIDIGPTLLGMMNFSYTSNFYGYDINKLEPGRERAFISTYQTLGYIREGKLVVLSPHAKAEAFELSPDNKVLNKITNDAVVTEAISWYQSASYSFRNGGMKYQEVVAERALNNR